MRKISITTLIVLLIFGSIAPYEISASSLEDSEDQLGNTDEEMNDVTEDDTNADVTINEDATDEADNEEEDVKEEEEESNDLKLPRNDQNDDTISNDDTDLDDTSKEENDLDRATDANEDQLDEPSESSNEEELIDSEEEKELDEVSTFSSSAIEESKTSRLGHIRKGATIYEELGNESSSFSSEDYLGSTE